MSTKQSSVAHDVKSLKENNGSQLDSRLSDAIKLALHSNHPVLQTALKQEQTFRAQTEEELEDLLANIRKLMHEKDLAQIKRATLERLDLDLELIGRLNTVIESYNPKDTQPKDYTAGDKNTCTYPLKFNKMALAIPGAKTIIREHFEDIFCKGTLPNGFVIHSKPCDITALGKNSHSIYGDSKGTFLKTAAFTTYLVCTDTTRLQDVNLRNQGKNWLDNTALAHLTHLPASVDLTKIDDRFSKFTYLFGDDTTAQGLAFVHSGYSFGGQRDTAYRYKMGTKPFGPEDCSSWIAKLSGSPIQFSTIDQIYSYRLSVLRNFSLNIGVVPSDYASNATATTMANLFDPVLVRDPQKDIRPGQIYAHRTYDLAADSSMQGPGTKGGHTGVVLDFISAGKDSSIAVLAYGRNMPDEEGFGVQQFPFAPENRKVMLFSLKSQKLGESAKSDTVALNSDAAARVAPTTTSTASTAITGHSKP